MRSEFLITFAAGASYGLTTVVVGQPLDTIKTRMQGLKAAEYSSTLDCFVKIATREGPLQFYSGAVARAARVVPGQGIIFMSQEKIYQFLASATGRG